MSGCNVKTDLAEHIQAERSLNHRIECEIYRKAKEKVLFEGFTPCIINGEQSVEHRLVTVYWSLHYGKKIEDINTDGIIELTESAIKQIGL